MIGIYVEKAEYSMKSVPTECPKTFKRITENFITFGETLPYRGYCICCKVLLDYSTDLALLSHQTLGTNFGN